MTAPRQITFFEPRLTQFAETMVRFTASDPQLAVRVVTSLDRGSEAAEHPWALDRLRRDPRIEVLDLTAPPAPSSLLVWAMVRHEPLSVALPGWLRQSAVSAIHPASNHYGSRADWLRELARAFPHFLRARFLILEREWRPLDFRFGCRQRVFYTPYVHPQFLTELRWGQAMFGPVPREPRRFRLTFLGSRQPPERTLRLEEARSALKASIAAHYPCERAAGVEALWIEYDVAAGTRGLDPIAYTAALSETEFCLSPPGWGRNWTHRTIEALARGAIPVIEDPAIYNLPFVDGENCIIAAPDDWAAAVRRCLASSPEEIAKMQEGVARLRESRVLPEVAARLFRTALLAQL